MNTTYKLYYQKDAKSGVEEKSCATEQLLKATVSSLRDSGYTGTIEVQEICMRNFFFGNIRDFQ